MEGNIVAGIRRGRCEFPNCDCPCMTRHGENATCSMCFHVDAWHANLDRARTTDYAEALELDGISAPIRVSTQPQPQPRGAVAAAAPRGRGRGTSRAASSTETLIANILSQEMKTDRTLCCICLQEHCNTVIKPCGHARFCNACVLSLPSPKQCPLCREPVLRKTNFIPI